MSVSPLLMRLMRTRRVTAIVTIITLVTLAIWPLIFIYQSLFQLEVGFHHGDFGAYYTAVQTWLDGDVLYEAPYFGGWLYPPIYLLVFLPFVILDFGVAAWIWTILSVLALWAGLQLVVRALGYRLAWWERLVGLWLLIGFHPLLYASRLGQASIMLAALMAVAVATAELDTASANRRFAYLSGILTTIAGTVKLFYATAGAHLLLDTRRFLGALVSGLVLTISSLLIFGLETHRGYIDMLLWGEDWGREPLPPTVWFPGYYRPHYLVDEYALYLRAVGVLAIIALALWTRHTGADREVFALGIVAIPLLGPQVSTHDLNVLLPAIILLIAIEFERGGYPIIPIIALWLTQVHIYGLFAIVNAPDWVPLSTLLIEWAALLQPALWANLILFVLAVYRVYEHRPLVHFADVLGISNH